MEAVFAAIARSPTSSDQRRAFVLQAVPRTLPGQVEGLLGVARHWLLAEDADLAALATTLVDALAATHPDTVAAQYQANDCALMTWLLTPTDALIPPVSVSGASAGASAGGSAGGAAGGAVNPEAAKARWHCARTLLGTFARRQNNTGVAAAAAHASMCNSVIELIDRVASSPPALQGWLPSLARVLCAQPALIRAHMQDRLAILGIGYLGSAQIRSLTDVAAGGDSDVRVVVRLVLLCWSTGQYREREGAGESGAAPFAPLPKMPPEAGLESEADAEARVPLPTASALDAPRLGLQLQMLFQSMCTVPLPVATASSLTLAAAQAGYGCLLMALGADFAPLLATFAVGARLGAAGFARCVRRVVCWPMVPQLATWAEALLQTLTAGGSHDSLALVLEDDNAMVRLATQLLHPALWVGALRVLERLMLSHRQGQPPSPRAFHRLLPALLQVAKQQARADASKSAPRIGTSDAPATERPQQSAELSWLLQCLIVLHPGFPQLYHPVLLALEELPPPPRLLEAATKARDAAQRRDELALGAAHVQAQEIVLQHVLSFSSGGSVGDGWGGANDGAAAGQLTQDRIIARAQLGAGVGLSNLGNTCYINSVLQALFLTSDMTRLLLRGAAAGLGNACSSSQRVSASAAPISGASQPSPRLLLLLRKLFALLCAGKRASLEHEPAALRSVLPAHFSDGTQQDAAEFARWLLDALGEMGGGELGLGPQVARLFSGRLTSTIRCSVCGTESKSTEPFIDLSLSFPEPGEEADRKLMDADTETSGGSCGTGGRGGGCCAGSGALSLEWMLRRFFAPELLGGQNQYACDACGGMKRDAHKQLAVSRAPQQLAITLKRFRYDGTSAKIMRQVSYPRELRLPLAADGRGDSCGVGLAGSNEALYVLYAVVIHAGSSSMYGHYYTYGTSSTRALAAATGAAAASHATGSSSGWCPWLQLNDSNVQVLRDPGATLRSAAERFPSDLPYMLLYQRIDRAAEPAATTTVVDHVDAPWMGEELRQHVLADNSRFEREAQQHSRRSQARPPLVAEAGCDVIDLDAYYDNNGDDGRGGGGSGFGGGGFGGGPAIC